MDWIHRAEGIGKQQADTHGMVTHIPVVYNGCTFLTTCTTASVSKILHMVI